MGSRRAVAGVASRTVGDFVVITGMSGAGRSTAADALEDLGWFVIDNLPPTLIEKVTELAQLPGSETPAVALVAGTNAYLEELAPAIRHLREGGHSRVRVIFLDAADDVLVRRYEQTRRRHPLDEHNVSGAIEREREMLTHVKAEADVVVDTTHLNVHQLRNRVVELFSVDEATQHMRTSVISFGYKHGIPVDVDLVLDCRFLPNPHWEPHLRPLTGLDAPVRDYVLEQPDTEKFVAKLDDLLELLLPAYVREGKSYLSIAVGCTGGRHRSVVLAEQIAERVRSHGFEPSVVHRDIAK